MSLAILGLYGWWQLRQEEEDLRKAAAHELKLVGAAVQGAVENSVRDGQVADIRKILDSLELGDSSLDVLVFDRARQLTASSWGAQQSVDLVRGAVSEVISTKRPLLRFEGPRGLSHLVAVFPLRDDDGTSLGTIAAVRPLDELRRDLRVTFVTTALSSVILIAAITGASWLLVLFIVRRPLRGLIEAMGAVRGGDLTASVPPQRADEVGELALEFNAMMSDLAEARRRLIETAEAREALEGGLQRVDKLVTLGQLSAGLAHEIGSPLQILNGRARALARRRDLPAEVVRTAEVLEAQSDRIAKIVEQLLNFARRKAAHMAEVDIGAVARTIVDLLEPEARRRGLRLHFECPDTLPRITADSDQIQQVTINLLNNALRAAAWGGQVRVALLTSEFKIADGGSAVASVSLVIEDTGAGIPHEVLHHIFEPFFTTWAETGGTGLGLAVVKSIVDEHGGTISVSSEQGSGTRFTVHFPVAGVARVQGLVA